MATHELTLNLKKTNIAPPVITVHQGDSAEVLKAAIYDGDLGGIAQQVAGKAGGAGAGTQDGVLHVDARALVQEQAGVVERDPAIVERLRAGHVDGGVLVGAHA